MISLAALFVGLVVVPTTIWIALAVHCHVRRPWLRWFVSCVPLTIVGASLGVLPLMPWAYHLVGVAGDHAHVVVFAASKIGR